MTNQILVIWDEKPEWIDITNYGRRANVRTYHRLNWLCALANGQATLAGVGDAIGPATVAYAYFDPSGKGTVFGNKDENKVLTLKSTWQLLDGSKGDCATIAALMKCCLDQLGAIGSEVRYVFPCSRSWSKLEDVSFDYRNREQRQGPNGAYLSVRILGVGRAWNWSKWEGCCKFSGKYWMGSYGTFKPTAKKVLTETFAYPNDDSDDTHQAYEDMPDTVVPFPTR